MKNLLALLILTLFALNANAQNSNAPLSDSIVFNKTVHDYGTMNSGDDGNCEFVFTNKGKTPIIIANVKASCGCTAPDWTREPVLPGKTGVIKAAYNTQIPGAFTKTITVNSNAVNSQVILIIKGNVITKN
jgi:hypothetical protein